MYQLPDWDYWTSYCQAAEEKSVFASHDPLMGFGAAGR